MVGIITDNSGAMTTMDLLKSWLNHFLQMTQQEYRLCNMTIASKSDIVSVLENVQGLASTSLCDV